VRFPGRYVVNSLPLYGTRKPDKGPRELRGRSLAPPPWNGAKRGSRPAEKAERSYPNSILIDRDSRQTTDRIGSGTAHDPSKCLGWIEGIIEDLTRESMNEGQAALKAG